MCIHTVYATPNTVLLSQCFQIINNVYGDVEIKAGTCLEREESGAKVTAEFGFLDVNKYIITDDNYIITDDNYILNVDNYKITLNAQSEYGKLSGGSITQYIIRFNNEPIKIKRLVLKANNDLIALDGKNKVIWSSETASLFPEEQKKALLYVRIQPSADISADGRLSYTFGLYLLYPFQGVYQSKPIIVSNATLVSK